jgi:tetratricopeptide (TPR) repeat protein
MLRRVLLAVAIGALAIAAVYWLSRREPASPESLSGESLVIPEGETIVRTLPDHEGNPEQWTLTKRKMSKSEREESLLPTPSPPETQADAGTDSSRALSAHALEAWKHGDLRGAVDLFEAAVAADPDDWVPRSEYGRLLLLMADYEQAWTQLERAAELEPDSPRVWIDLISFYERNMLFERAASARRRAEELTGGQAIVQDKTGLWRLENESIFP